MTHKATLICSFLLVTSCNYEKNQIVNAQESSSSNIIQNYSSSSLSSSSSVVTSDTLRTTSTLKASTNIFGRSQIQFDSINTYLNSQPDSLNNYLSTNSISSILNFCNIDTNQSIVYFKYAEPAILPNSQSYINISQINKSGDTNLFAHILDARLTSTRHDAMGTSECLKLNCNNGKFNLFIIGKNTNGTGCIDSQLELSVHRDSVNGKLIYSTSKSTDFRN